MSDSPSNGVPKLVLVQNSSSVSSSSTSASSSDEEKRKEIFERAYKRYGAGTSVGRDGQKPDSPFFVKVRSKGYEGWGKSFEEALANVGPPPPKKRR